MTCTPGKTCKHGHKNGRETIEFCQAHQAEHNATRERWHADYLRQHENVAVTMRQDAILDRL